MNSLIAICLILSLALIFWVIFPFFWGEGGWLQDARGEDSVALVEAREEALLKRWLEDEKAFENGLITSKEWSMRQVYLSNRYVDAARRLDWLKIKDSDHA